MLEGTTKQGGSSLGEVILFGGRGRGGDTFDRADAATKKRGEKKKKRRRRKKRREKR